MNDEIAIPGQRLAAGFINMLLFTLIMRIAGTIHDSELRLYALLILPLTPLPFSITRSESIGNLLLKLRKVDRNNNDLNIKKRVIRGILPILMLHVFTISSLPEGFYSESLSRVISPTVSLLFVLNGLYIFLSPTHKTVIDLVLETNLLKTKTFKPLKNL